MSVIRGIINQIPNRLSMDFQNPASVTCSSAGTSVTFGDCVFIVNDNERTLDCAETIQLLQFHILDCFFTGIDQLRQYLVLCKRFLVFLEVPQVLRKDRLSFTRLYPNIS